MSVQLGWFSEDFKNIAHLRRLIARKVAVALTAATEPISTQEGIFKIEDESDSPKWMRIILPHGLSTGYQLIGMLEVCTF